MRLRELREQVLHANLELQRSRLVILTWGNASGIDRESGLVAIKPSGVPYAELTVDAIVLVDLDGVVVEGDRRPSSDTATHLALYRAFGAIGGVTHTHSKFATSFAQSLHPIPFLGTTHADHFNGPVPVTRPMTPEETNAAYEARTGDVIVERFAGHDPMEMPGVLVAHHGAFTWGVNPAASAVNATVLEAVADLAFHTLALEPGLPSAPQHLLTRHFTRKHGPNAYYGNPPSNPRKVAEG